MAKVERKCDLVDVVIEGAAAVPTSVAAPKIAPASAHVSPRRGPAALEVCRLARCVVGVVPDAVIVVYNRLGSLGGRDAGGAPTCEARCRGRPRTL